MTFWGLSQLMAPGSGNCHHTRNQPQPTHRRFRLQTHSPRTIHSRMVVLILAADSVDLCVRVLVDVQVYVPGFVLDRLC